MSWSPQLPTPIPNPPPFHRPKHFTTMTQLKQHHSQLIRLGLTHDLNALSRLLQFCSLSKTGDFSYALQLFDGIPQPDTFIYNTIIKAHLLHHSHSNCILLYTHMLESCVLPNEFTFPLVIRACNFVENGVVLGKQVYGHVFKFGFGANGACLNNLIYMFVEFQALDEARRVFDGMVERDVVSCTSLVSGYCRWGFIDEALEVFWGLNVRSSALWNAMIAGLVQNNQFHEAFDLFDQMRAENGAGLDKFVAASMLSACTGLGALEQGKWLHRYIVRNGIEMDSKLGTAIIDMYCKCGCLEEAFEAFEGLPCKGTSSWNSMIGGLAMHGEGEAAIELFRRMERDGRMTPDYITFLSLLGACAHSGLVEKGHYYFDYMIRVYGIEPRREHFGCLVDLLGRAGMLEEAQRLIAEMPMSPDVSILGTLFGACKNHRNVELGEAMGRRLIELEPENSGRYVLLANLYADAGRWEEVANVRKLMNDRVVKKAPGYSMIELDGSVIEFAVSGSNHPQVKEVYAKVDEMLECIKSAASVFDICEMV